MVVLLLLLLLLLSVSGQDCEPPCHNDGFCTVGPPDFSDHPLGDNGKPFDFHEHLDPSFHCECPGGLTGLTCEQHYVACQSGGHYCYHGGTCISIQVMDDLEEEGYICDCRNAVNNQTGVSYVGRFCEHAVVQQCGDQVNEDTVACVNGGFCAPNTTTCTCPKGFTGAHCEFLKSRVPSCDLRCKNGGQCKLGLRDFTATEEEYFADEETNDNFQHCICPHGYSGFLCQRQERVCGSQIHCFHGSTCVSQVDALANKIEFGCNCTNANTNEHAYSGVGCEHESTSFCTRLGGTNGHAFCTNNGTCFRSDNGVYGCSCPAGFKGARCQIREDQIPNLPEEYHNCTLSCSNGGLCREGVKDHGILNRFDGIDHITGQTIANTTVEHCECPTGFAGVLCEHRVSICGQDGTSVCFHGSECVEQDDSGWACDCNATSENVAGVHCQHKATSMCPVSDPEQDVMFCVNGGLCEVSNNDGVNYCKCRNGFEGLHCEFNFLKKPVSGNLDDDIGFVDEDSKSSDAASRLAVFSIILGTTAFGCAAFVLSYTIRERIRQTSTESDDFLIESYATPGREIL